MQYCTITRRPLLEPAICAMFILAFVLYLLSHDRLQIVAHHLYYPSEISKVVSIQTCSNTIAWVYFPGCSRLENGKKHGMYRVRLPPRGQYKV